MMSDQKMNTKDFFIGTLVGGVVGATISLLLAPKSGKDLRGNLNEQARTAMEKSSSVASSAKKRLTAITKSTEDLVDDLGDLGENIASSVRQEVEDLQRSVEQLINEVEAQHSQK